MFRKSLWPYKKVVVMSLSMYLILGPFRVLSAFESFNTFYTWQNNQLLPHYEEFEKFYSKADDISKDLNEGSGEYKLAYKIYGGSSHKAYVIRSVDNKKMGIWSPPNHATYILGEIFAFNLARLLGRPSWSRPATRMTLVGPAREMAYNVLNTKTKSVRICNRDTILSYMKENPYYITGVFVGRMKGQDSVGISELVDTKAGNRLNPAHFIVKMIEKNGPVPTGKVVYLNKGHLSYTGNKLLPHSTDSELAKQLSFMMIVDALNSQRDRFGFYGSNMEGYVSEVDKSLTLVGKDNGGITDSSSSRSLLYFTGKYGNGVGRFEKEIYDKVMALYQLVYFNKTSPFFEFKNADELKMALGYEDEPDNGFFKTVPVSCKSSHSWLFAPLKTRWDKKWEAFRLSLKKMADYLSQFKNDEKAFFSAP